MSRQAHYRKLLKDKRWSLRRMEIMRRDGFRCRRCGATSHLNVHHRWYVYGRRPWEYSDRYLVTLCEQCHRHVHLMRHVWFAVWFTVMIIIAYLLKIFLM